MGIMIVKRLGKLTDTDNFYSIVCLPTSSFSFLISSSACDNRTLIDLLSLSNWLISSSFLCTCILYLYITWAYTYRVSRKPLFYHTFLCADNVTRNVVVS